MYSVSLITISILALLGQLVSAEPADSTPRETKKCFYYTGANTNTATCNDIPGVSCTGGCGGTFNFAEECRPSDGSDPQHIAPPTNQTCDLGFGRDTAAAKACVTTTGMYSCRGKITPGETYCYGCNIPKNM
ncbi:hypothetical protein PGT21_022021 [Puccinia graminis f. sp. tritici]|uniref:Secreted protein n=2 Tax=Puccinia graminis f. sp. tritici TaxID=56615 RepID=E3KX13_PUCGT|nr:uncharacterized protein PGTG_14245 [Puccinia graminis f. sp. tritici CRL 75-36-700-3]EFP88906.1 hypothetical protein PGTG_14245 [Puccinia graminis f. sp. tritici CRL 75-36-700-3]KAA1113124.1 hypothetical protein PGT21_022021 [Puccinia graminis f. sp. tritici]KAA1113704.1 hypothetical protein PGTUg99_022667 [Puccinia graminis f. sp. tritici]